MPRTKTSKFKGTQRQFMTEKEGSQEAKRSSSERKLESSSSADRPTPFSKKDENFAAVEGNRIIDMKLLQDALTEAHVCPEGIH